MRVSTRLERALRVPVALGACSAFASGAASAAGYDTPILYSARHLGMGGAAVGGVDDPSAAFHNPAGLQGVRGLAFLGDVSLLFAHFTSSPAPVASASGIQSDLVIAPHFLAAAAYRLQPWLSLGVAVFPGGAAGADYSYSVPGSPAYQHDDTTIVFYELTPLLSLNVPKDAVLPGELSVGVGYRMSLVRFQREEGEDGAAERLSLDMQGRDYKGFRVGLQYRPGKFLSIGAVYRNKLTITSRADEATVLGQPAVGVELPFVLPAQLGGGIRLDIDRLGVAFDALYTFQSQNRQQDLTGAIGGAPFLVPNIFDWKDAYTLRFGFEYRLGPSEEVPIRVGYVYDGQVSSRAYPWAFGAPPAPTRTVTLGGGYTAPHWELNLALALLGGSTEVQVGELGPAGACPACSYSGNYEVSATGVYLDLSTDIDL